MQITLHLHEMSNPVFWENKKNIINLSSAENVQRVVKIKVIFKLLTVAAGTLQFKTEMCS